jgi:hypothetical protein
MDAQLGMMSVVGHRGVSTEGRPSKNGCMQQSSSAEITGLLIDWGQGDKSALDRVIPIVYKELRRLAHRQMKRER